jgi:hypothetical protein
MKCIGKTQVYDAQKIAEFIFDAKTSVNYVKLEDGSRILRPLTHGYTPEVGDYVITAYTGDTYLISRRVFNQAYEILPDALVVEPVAEPAVKEPLYTNSLAEALGVHREPNEGELRDAVGEQEVEEPWHF